MTMTRGPESAKRDLRNLEKVRGIFASLSKYIHAKTIYANNNPNVARFASVFYESVRAFFEDEKELLLSIEQYQIKWREEVVYDNSQKNESIAFLFYRDGVGEIIFQASVKPDELDRFVDLLKDEIYNPSAHFDIVSRLWQAEFTNIYYRVFDECADGAAGDGRGSGGESREQPLRVHDHPNVPDSDTSGASDGAARGGPTESLGAYLHRLVENKHPFAAAHEKEAHIQRALVSLLAATPQDLQAWRDEFTALNGENKLLWLMNTMLDFTQEHRTPAEARDILDIIERFVRYAVEEAHVPTLIALFDLQRNLESSRRVAADYQSLSSRIKDELTNRAFLISLGTLAHRSREDIHDILQYFQLVGKNAVPGVRELLGNLEDPSIIKEACDALIAIAGDDIISVVNDFKLDNPDEARAAVYILRQLAAAEVSPIVKTLMTSPDRQVREHVIGYLVHVGNEEAARLLCTLLDDVDADVRIKTLVAVEDFKSPLIVEKIGVLCFSEGLASRNAEELEKMFRALGKLAGERVLPELKQMVKKKGWVSLNKGRDKQSKLLAITALRHIQGADSVNLLTELARDGDSLVRTKAQYVLKQIRDPKAAPDAEQTPVGSGEAR
jgi:hypothetical protein